MRGTFFFVGIVTSVLIEFDVATRVIAVEVDSFPVAFVARFYFVAHDDCLTHAPSWDFGEPGYEVLLDESLVVLCGFRVDVHLHSVGEVHPGGLLHSYVVVGTTMLSLDYVKFTLVTRPVTHDVFPFHIPGFDPRMAGFTKS